MKPTQALPRGLIFATDLVGVVFTLAPSIVALALPLALLRRCETRAAFWLALVSAPAVAFGGFLLTLIILRLFLPRLKGGVARFGANRPSISWYGHLALGRAVKVCGLWPLLRYAPALCRLYLRSMGAAVGRGVRFDAGVELVDLPLVTIGDNVHFHARACVVAHNAVKGRLIVSPVVIGRGAEIGAGCQIGLGARIGANTKLGAGNLVAGREIPADTVIGDYTLLAPEALMES
jgi:acetyltransferase-like isoleucine patch superfamily enzyme